MRWKPEAQPARKKESVISKVITFTSLFDANQIIEVPKRNICLFKKDQII